MKSSSNDPEMQSWTRIATCARLKMRIEELREENTKLREAVREYLESWDAGGWTINPSLMFTLLQNLREALGEEGK